MLILILLVFPGIESQDGGQKFPLFHYQGQKGHTPDDLYFKGYKTSFTFFKFT